MFKNILRPTLVLMLICGIASGVLALSYNLLGIGEIGNGLSEEELNEYMPVVTPKAEKLIKADFEITNKNVIGVYADNENNYTAVHIEIKGYSSGLKILVGFDEADNVVGVKVTDSQETPGIGTQIENDDFISQFINISTIKQVDEVDTISGATYSSKGFKEALKIAVDFYKQYKGGEIQ